MTERSLTTERVITTCPKCGREGIEPRYHKQGCSDDKCGCADCSYGSHAKKHEEHLHYHCRCGFDWIGEVLA